MISTSPEIQHQYGYKTTRIAKAATMKTSTTSSLRIQQKEQYQYQVLNQAQISSEGLPRVGNDGIGSEKKTYTTAGALVVISA